MFKKMKDRITDEVNSATNKLQNMQLMDQLASNSSQHNLLADQTPNQILPGPSDLDFNPVPTKNYSADLIPQNNSHNLYNENSGDSPQDQLFAESSIKRSSNLMVFQNSKLESQNKLEQEQNVNSIMQDESILDLMDINSDLDDSLNNLAADSSNGSPDAEIDLLNNETILMDDVCSPTKLLCYKEKYRAVVHAARRLKLSTMKEKENLQQQNSELYNQIITLKQELADTKHFTPESNIISSSDRCVSDNSTTSTKGNSKLRDLEKLLAKCKESLKQKNSQIQTLKESLLEVDNFRDYSDKLRRELAELRAAHESWTVSIAENKRVTHQEMEIKNTELEHQRSETNDLQLRLNDSQNRIKQLKSAIQDLESRLVSTSAAHHKERESLTKEFNSIRSNALKQLKKEHEHNLERVKLDLEKSIEALKLESLTKDEQLMKYIRSQEELLKENQDLMDSADDMKQQLQSKVTESEELQQKLIERDEDFLKLKDELERLRIKTETTDQLDLAKRTLTNDIETIKKQLHFCEYEKSELEKRFSDLESVQLDIKNQALIHNQSLYDERIQILEDQIVKLTKELEECNSKESVEKDPEGLRAEKEYLTATEFEYLKNIGEYRLIPTFIIIS